MQMRTQMRPWIRCAAWLCLSLMLWTAAVECVHNHPTQADSSSCSICAVAHSANPAPSTVDARPVFAAVGICHEKEVLTKGRLDFFDLGIRGPPNV